MCTSLGQIYGKIYLPGSVLKKLKTTEEEKYSRAPFLIGRVWQAMETARLQKYSENKKLSTTKCCEYLEVLSLYSQD